LAVGLLLGAGLSAVRSADADAPKHMKWEHRYVGGLSLTQRMEYDRRHGHAAASAKDIQVTLKNLNAAGAEGWRVVALMESGYLLARERP
jgi:phosphatidylethanolamine-binding protein (PEBP) family uncharacterized protein